MSIISTQAFTFRLVANGTQLDLFDDENILLSNNVTGLFDIGVLPSDFTRQITLPGTKINNAFFEHVYDISIDSPFLFATNIKVPAYFDFDSVYLSQGYLQLNKVNVRANKFIESYEVTIYGTLSSFGRDINRNYLTDLTSLAQYNHTSSYANISSSWSGQLFDGNIVYPFADYGTGWEYTSGDDFFGLDDSEGGINIQDYKPSIRAKAVLDAIFTEAGYTYTSSFLNQDWFQDVYMVCDNQLKYPIYSGVNLENYGVAKWGPISGSGMTDTNLPDNTTVQFPWINILDDKASTMGSNANYNLPISSSLRGILNLNFNVSCSINNPPQSLELHYWPTGSTPGGAGSGATTLVNFNNYFSQFYYSRTGGLNQTFELSTKFATSILGPNSYYFGIKVNDWGLSPAPTVTLDPGGTTKSYINITKVNFAADGRIMDIPSNMPFGTNGIKQIDFIIGLQRKFNLVIYPNKSKPNEFIIEAFNNWYNRGRRWDFNKYINLDESIEVIPANNLAVNQLTFGDTLDQDYISQQFSKEANREYGKVYYTDTTNFFSQGSYDVKTTFGNGPLAKIAGTGLSGSVSGVLPPPITQFLVGYCRFGFTYNPSDTCSSPARIYTYTTSGMLEVGLIAYRDQYGESPILGLNFITGPSGGTIYSLNSSTGQITSITGYYC